MILDKVARLTNNPEHLDSWIDIAGYARCAVMIMDEREQRANDNYADGIRAQHPLVNFGVYDG